MVLSALDKNSGLNAVDSMDPVLPPANTCMTLDTGSFIIGRTVHSVNF